MKGIQIFVHSLRQVTGNFEGALRVSAVPYGAQLLCGLLLVGAGFGMGPIDPGNLSAGAGSSLILLVIVNLAVALVTGIWVAVAWHRYVLKGEMPNGFLPPFQRDRILAYFLRSLGIGLLCVVLSIPFGFLGAIVAYPFIGEYGPSLFGFALIFLVTYLPLTVVSLRLSAALPASALDAPAAYTAGWNATQGEWSTFIVLALIMLLAFFVVSQVAGLLLGGIMVLALVWQVVFGWFTMMIGLSILTTLYGHYIEGRPLV